jgi:fructose-bisphosphate aldolase, class I
MTSAFEEENSFVPEMEATARRIARRGYGILATDESTPTAGRRLDTIGVTNTEGNRRSYREMLYTSQERPTHLSPQAANAAVVPSTC